ncbi:MAG TPA: nucleotidyltransferase family protein [Allosphingosinicella sp.]|nr:nucleotidyltransferase family protein [Allosphingosinicella sp.]
MPAKALIEVGGEPMLARVLHTLMACPQVGPVVVLGQDAEALLSGRLAELGGHPRVSAVEAREGISASLSEVVGTERAPYPVLVTTADHPLLRPEFVSAFLAGAEGADAAFGVVDRWTVEALHPGTKRTWIKFADGHWSGANLFAFMNPRSRAATDFWAGVEHERKRALKLVARFGPAILLRTITRTISLSEAAQAAGRRFGVDVRAVPLPFAEAAIDVDKPSDLELAERILAGRLSREA